MSKCNQAINEYFLKEQMADHNIVREIKYAIANNDIKQMYYLKDICDKLHSGMDECNGYTKLPEDQLYEEMNEKIKDISAYQVLSSQIETNLKMLAAEISVINKRGLNHAITINSNGKEVNGNLCFTHDDKLPELWMGSIPKQNTIAKVNSALIMPKFDGCSCGVKYVKSCVGTFEPKKATTRGVNDAFRKQSSDILQKFETISSPMTSALNSNVVLEFKFSNGRLLSEAESINIRGEIVAKNKSDIFTAPASYIAGKLNGGFDIWEKSSSKIEFIPFEIIIVKFSDGEYVPTQKEVNAFFSSCNLQHYSIMESDIDENSLDIIRKYFVETSNQLPEPMDGVVYCPSNWKYPRTKESKTPANYGKLAWKPSSEATSVLRSVEYTIARDGKITLILKYDPIKICGKTFKQAKTAPTRMRKLTGIGIGSIVTVELCNDINPQIKDFEEDSSILPYEFITTCPFCGSPLKHETKKDVLTISCKNKLCPEIMIQKMKNFLTIINIKGIAEGKLRKLKKLTLEEVNDVLMRDDSIAKGLNNITLAGFMGAIGFGTSSQIERATANVNNRTPLTENLDLLDSIAQQMNDPFVYDVIDFILNHV